MEEELDNEWGSDIEERGNNDWNATRLSLHQEEEVDIDDDEDEDEETELFRSRNPRDSRNDVMANKMISDVTVTK